MKRFAIFIVLALSVLNMSAQKVSLNKAYNAYYEKDFVKAKEAIDLCTADPKLSVRAQTWLYKGNINFYLANQEYGEKQQNMEYQVVYPNSPVDAYDAFVKALEIDKKAESYEMLTPNEGIAKLYPLLLIRGVDLLIAHDYEFAKSVLEKAIYSYELKTPEHPLHGEIYYYYAYALDMLGLKEQTKQYYEKAIADGSSNAGVYVRLIEQYKTENNPAKVIELIDKAKVAIPDNPNILVTEVDYYWEIDQEKSLALLAQLPSSAYSDPDALINLANIHIKNKDFVNAEELLAKANRVTPGNFVIVYNLGYCYLNLYDQKLMEANELSIAGKNAESDQASELAQAYFRKVEYFFEEAIKLESDNLSIILSILEQLKIIYARERDPKHDQIIERINSINNK